MLNILFAVVFPFAFAQEKIQVRSFTPQGFVKSVEQVRIEFQQPMVRFGELKLEAPVQSDCLDPRKGQGRWIDTRNWVFDFTDPLVGGRSCEVNIHGKVFKFHTGGPHVREIFPQLYRTMDPNQNFLVFLDSPIKKESLRLGAYFVVEGLGDRIGVLEVTGAEKEKIFKAAQAEYKYESESFKGEYLVIRAQRPFPPGARVSFVWSRGIQSPTGVSSKDDETFEFTVQEPFKAEFKCERESATKPCIPLLPMRLSFTTDISLEDARRIYLETSEQKKIYAQGLLEEGASPRTSYLEFKGPFQENTVLTLVLPKDLKDEEGRSLSNQAQFPLEVKTGEAPALLKFASDFGVIEAGPEAALPVTLRRVEKNLDTHFAGWTGRLTAANFKLIAASLSDVQKNSYGDQPLATWHKKTVDRIKITKPLQPSELEVVGIPLKKSGFYVVEMKSPLLGQSLLDQKKPFYVRSAALVTNLAVHIKHTRKEAAVWVTELKTAKVVPGAKVRIFDNAGSSVAEAITDTRGWAAFAFKKPVSDWARTAESFYYDGFFAVAEKNEDFSFTHSSWDRGIESWRYQLRGGDIESPLVGHAILDRNLLKPEEKMSAKIILRKVTAQKMGLPSGQEWPEHLIITHDTGMQTFKLPLKWNQQKGFALIEWKIPAGAKLGRWSLSLERQTPALQIPVGDISVESFRVPLVQLRLSGSQPVFVMEREIPLQISGTYFAGGPTKDMPVKLRWSVEPGYFSPQDEDLADFSFANGAVKEGLFRQGEESSHRYVPQSGARDLKLNSEGGASEKVSGLQYAAAPQNLRTEVEYKDPNGEIQSVVRSFPLWSTDLVLGIKARGWSATPDKVEFEVVALDLQQNPVVGKAVQVDLFTSRYYSHRKRLVGGFYAYEDFREYKKIGELCRGVTDSKGRMNCRGKTKVAGSVIAVVTARDSGGRLSYANVNQWVVRPGENQWFGSEDNDRVDLIPFKKTYEPGEVAELQLRTPFPSAKVLVTVEREGILHSEVVDVSGEQPTIRVPIKKNYAPNVVISAFAIRGRLNDPKPTALVDLGKPAYKLGMAEVKVGWKENTLKVAVVTDRKSYKARERSLVTVSVQDHAGRPAAGADVALVAVDEGLLALKDNSSWDLLDAMMKLRPHLVQTATSQTLVVGKRHFGLKALPIGGDGGGGLRRELFDTLLYWNPSVKLDSKGQAQVRIPLNDSTTSFRIVAVAAQGSDQFGTGWTSIQSSQELMILPGLAEIAREGDEFRAGFTVRNATEEVQNLSLSLTVTPAAGDHSVQKIRLQPGEAKELFWSIRVPAVGTLTYILTAKNAQGRVVDEIKKIQKVLPVRVARIYQSEWGVWPDFKNLLLQQPQGAVKGASSVVVEVSPSLAGNSEGLRDYWKNYEYSCLEQQVSRAVSLNDLKLWQKIEEKLDVYIDGNGLVRYFPGSGSNGSVNLTAYLLNVTHEADFSLSEEHEARLLDSLSAYAEGRLREVGELDRADSGLKRISALETLSRYRRLNLSQLQSIAPQLSQWPLYTLVEWYQIHLWEKNIPQREKKLSEIENALRSRFYFSAKRLQLRDEGLDSMPWLMRNSDSSLLRLTLATLSVPQWKMDSLRLWQGVLARQSQGAWMLTSDNAWGALVLRRVQQAYGKEKIEGKFTASISGRTESLSWAQAKERAINLPWLEERSELKLEQFGAGQPWITVSAKAAVPVTKPVFAGFQIEKTVTPVEQRKSGLWSVGDVARVQLKVRAKAPQTWMVIEDPVPAGASLLQASYTTAVERKAELIRFYQSWFPQEEQILEYTLRFNQAGTYQLPVTRVEAMYSPDLFAELPESQWKVLE